jgi:AbrB family looped-hinge helix DNA binding protein
MADGNFDGMQLRIDKSGRIVVPKVLRERLGFEAGSELEAIEEPDGVLLKKVQTLPSMMKIDGLWVHQGIPQPGADWERVLEEVREERTGSLL